MIAGTGVHGNGWLRSKAHPDGARRLSDRVVAAAGFMLLSPDAPHDPERWADLGIILAAGLVAGFVYWLIAGRDAGFRRPLIERLG